MSKTVEKTEAEAKNDPAMITLEKIRKWSACQDGRDWFRGKFPQGGSYGDVMTALYADKRYADGAWLADKAFDVANISAAFIESDVRSVIDATKFEVEIEGIEGDNSEPGVQAGFSGDCAQAGFSGDGARAGFSGDGAIIDCSGQNCTFAIAGQGAVVKVGPGGAASIAWHDGKRIRFVTIYEGEDGILPDVSYKIENGKAVAA